MSPEFRQAMLTLKGVTFSLRRAEQEHASARLGGCLTVEHINVRNDADRRFRDALDAAFKWFEHEEALEAAEEVEAAEKAAECAASINEDLPWTEPA